MDSSCNGLEYALICPADEYIHEIAKLEKRCFPDDPWTEKMFRDAAENDNCIIAAIIDMQTTKMAAYSVLYSVLDQADLANIAVSPEYRGKGLGRSLLEISFHNAELAGACEIFLEVRSSNKIARNLYETSGFEQIGIRKNYYSSPREDAVIMSCKLK